MNVAQRRVLGVGGAITGLMLLFPPTYVTGYGDSPDGPTHYEFLMGLPSLAAFDNVPDLSRLALQLAVVAVATVVALVLVRRV